MKYQKRNIKIKQKKIFKIRYIRKFAIFSILVILAILTLNPSFKKIQKSAFFEVRTVVIKGNPGWLEHSVRFLIGKNLFSIDLDKVRNRLKYEHSEIEEISLSRLWPDAIYIKFTLRKAVATLAAREDLLVDKYGFFLERGKYKEAVLDLPLIQGISLRGSERKKRINLDAKVTAAFELIQLYSKSGILDDYRLIEVDVGHISKNALSISKKESGKDQHRIIVKVGEGSYKRKLEMLEVFLNKADFNWANINYVDLRFNEPIVGLKDGQ